MRTAQGLAIRIGHARNERPFEPARRRRRGCGRIQALEAKVFASTPPPGNVSGISLGPYNGSFYNQGKTPPAWTQRALIGRWPKVVIWYPNVVRWWGFKRPGATTPLAKALSPT